MHIPSDLPPRLARGLFAAAFIALAGCSGGGGSSPGIPSNGLCDANAEFLNVARPSPGFAMNGNTIEIVSSTQNDSLHGNPTAFDLDVVDNFNTVITTGPLTAVNDNGGPHPFTNDFYYAGTLNGVLSPGRTYRVFLNVPSSSCQQGLVGQFST